MTREEFCKEYNLTEEQFFGKEEIKGDLDLSSLTSIPEGFNPNVGGGLYLDSLTYIPEGFNPTVGSHLYLNKLTSIPEGFNPTVGGYLNLSSLTSIPEGFNPMVGDSLWLNSLTTILEGFNPTVGGTLDLRSLTSIPEGFNPTVGGTLYLNSLTTILEGFNPTVGGNLNLSSLTSIPEGFNPTVGWYLNLPKGIICDYNKLEGPVTWGDKYIKVDGIFTEIVNKKGCFYRVKRLNEDKMFYLVTDGNNRWSHGDTLKEAKVDLTYKIVKKNKVDYKYLTLESELSFEDAIVCYRVLTGACSFGVKDFIKKNEIKKKSYKIEEIVELTDGYYGNKEFISYFSK